MKKLLKKPWFTNTILMVLVVAVFLINLWIMSLEMDWSLDSDNFLGLSIDGLSEGPLYIFAFVIMLVFYVTIIPIVLSGLSLLKRNSWGFILAGLVSLGLEITLIVFQYFGNSLPLFASILVIVNIVLILAIFTFTILRSKILVRKIKPVEDTQNIKRKDSKIPLFTLLLTILAIAIFLTTFVVPLYTQIDGGTTYNAVLINSLLQGDSNEEVVIYFLVNITLFLGIFLYFSDSLSNYILNKEKFMFQSRRLVKVIFVATAIFFLAGLVIDILFTLLWQVDIQTISILPMLMMFFVIFTNALLVGKYDGYAEVETPKQKKIRKSNIEALLYLIVLSAVTVLMLFLPIVKIDITSGAYVHSINLTGFTILRDYPVLETGYRAIAYMLVVMLIAIGGFLALAITSYLSRSKQFVSILKFAAVVNVFFVFIISISGYYFQIARDINNAIIIDMASFYGINNLNPIALDYEVGTDAIYALAASLFILILMLARKVFDREEDTLLEANLLGGEGIALGEESEEIIPDTSKNFDPCYSFSELDSKIPLFQQDLEKRKTQGVGESTLNGLVNFIVEYARNSRLHLSYTNRDIATFVAGLGASRLSILQGMSGTGKTSLPKIFSEAIYGNCDIIEVESSWKDKNELLGYYNEFSMQYTPKKFTLALYKAALNKEIFTFILLDEMNLSRIEYYFSDFLSLMENEEDQREIKLVNIKLSRKEAEEEIEYSALQSGHTLKVPANVWFIGTANRDESTFVISDKVYDRAHTMNFTKRAPKVRNYSDPIPKQYYDYQTMNALFENTKKNGTFDAENSELIRSIEKLLAPYNISFGNRILKQIEDFVNIYNECFIDEDVESEAIEKILLSKAVSKLEVKTIEDKDKLIMDFEKLNLFHCAEFIKHLDED